MTPLLSAVLRGAGWVDAAGPGSPTAGRPFCPGLEPLPPIRWQQVSEAPNPRFGRLDPFTRTGLLAVATALKDAGLAEVGGAARRPIGIIASSDLGCLATDLDYYDTALPDDGALASPNRFVYTLPSCFLGEAAITFGLTGPGFVVNPGPDDPFAALAAALDWLAAGACSAMLAGFCDAPPAEPAVAGVPGGAGFVVLERAPHPSQRGSGAFPQVGRALCEELSDGDKPLVTRTRLVQPSGAQSSCPSAERPRSRPYPPNILTCQSGLWLLNDTPIHTWADLFALLCARPCPPGDAP